MLKKYSLILLFLLFSCAIKAQSYSYAWFTDTHVGSPTGEADLTTCVNNVNSRTDIDFVVVTGDVGEKGRNAELTKAKEILDQLKVKYYIFPGNHDTKWSESFCTKFLELWGSDKFAFVHKKIKHIGLNSGIIWRGGGGHVAAEDLVWLDSVITATPKTQPIFFYSHHPLDGDIDNWFKVTNILRKRDVKVVLYGHGHVNRAHEINGIPAFESRATLGGKIPVGYTLCHIANDTAWFSEVNPDSVRAPFGVTSLAEPRIVPQIDSLQFQNYTARIDWMKDLKTTVSAAPVSYKDKIIVATVDGNVHCFSTAGKEEWKFNAGGHICSRPVVHQDIVAIATNEGDLFTLRIATGKVIQSIGLDERVTGQLAVYPTTFQEEKTTGLLIGTASGKLLCYDLFLLNQIWVNNSAQAMIETLPLFVNDRIIYGSWDNYLYCIDAKTGMLNWKWTENKNFYYSPAAYFPVSDGKFVYVSTPDKFISKIDLLLGKTVWRKNSAGKPEAKKPKKKDAKTADYSNWETLGLSADNSRLFVKCMSNRFLILDPENGDIIKDYNLNFGLDTTPAELHDRDNAVVFGAKNGVVYRVNDNDAAPMFFMGTSRILTVANCPDGRFAACSMDGVVTLFGVPEENK